MKKVLYIEDNADNRDLVTQILSPLYEVDTAADGESGLEKARTGGPDLILIDVSLPVIDGLTCTRRLREDERTRTIPVVALTAHCMVGDRKRALEAGCDGFMSKPFRVAELRATVAELLDGGTAG